MLITAKNLEKIYGTGQGKVYGLYSTNLAIEAGETVAIVGNSGSGKSTLLRLLGGLDTPTSGSVFINEQDIFQLNEDDRSAIRRKYMGFIFQEFLLISVLSVYENITFPLSLNNQPIDKHFLRHVVDFLGLSDKLHRMPYQLSGGEQQRTAIARAIITKPQILFADEPTGSLDEKNSLEVVNLLMELTKESKTALLLVTHNPDVAHSATRIVHMRDGQLIDF